MLRQGFLGHLSNWVATQTDKNETAFKKASDTFGLYKFLKNTADQERIIGLFSEWLVFDHRQSIFGNMTGLEYFTANNPLNLPGAEISAYQDLLKFEVGLFEVHEIETGRGVTLLSVANGNEYFVHDVNASLSLKPDDTVWGRIAPVGGLYHAVGSNFFSMSIKIMAGMQGVISEWKKNSFDAREVTSWLDKSGSESQKADVYVKKAADGIRQGYADSERVFVDALKRCRMENFFTLETYKEWLINEKYYKMNFAARALVCLIPDDVNENDALDLIQAGYLFANNVPRKALKGKTPNEAFLEKAGSNQQKWEIDIWSKEKYIKDLELASEYLGKGDFKQSYKCFEQVIRSLLKDRVPLVHAFRIYANAAVCCFHRGEGYEMLGEELLNAALRINPLYDFALSCQEKYVNPYCDFSDMTVRDRKKMEKLRKDMVFFGKQEYCRKVFFKYEKFLADLGVSLKYEVKSKPAIYSYDKDGKVSGKIIKIGRNDLCYCGSGKKYKKCCGKDSN